MLLRIFGEQPSSFGTSSHSWLDIVSGWNYWDYEEKKASRDPKVRIPTYVARGNGLVLNSSSLRILDRPARPPACPSTDPHRAAVDPCEGALRLEKLLDPDAASQSLSLYQFATASARRRFRFPARLLPAPALKSLREGGRDWHPLVELLRLRFVLQPPARFRSSFFSSFVFVFVFVCLRSSRSQFLSFSVPFSLISPPLSLLFSPLSSQSP